MIPDRFASNYGTYHISQTRTEMLAFHGKLTLREPVHIEASFPLPILYHDPWSRISMTGYAPVARNLQSCVLHATMQILTSRTATGNLPFIRIYWSVNRFLYRADYTLQHLFWMTSTALPRSSLTLKISDDAHHQLLISLENFHRQQSTISGLLALIRSFLSYFSRYNCIFHPTKCVRFDHSFTYWGRTISVDGTNYDPIKLNNRLHIPYDGRPAPTLLTFHTICTLPFP